MQFGKNWFKASGWMLWLGMASGWFCLGQKYLLVQHKQGLGGSLILLGMLLTGSQWLSRRFFRNREFDWRVVGQASIGFLKAVAGHRMFKFSGGSAVVVTAMLLVIAGQAAIFISANNVLGIQYLLMSLLLLWVRFRTALGRTLSQTSGVLISLAMGIYGFLMLSSSAWRINNLTVWALLAGTLLFVAMNPIFTKPTIVQAAEGIPLWKRKGLVLSLTGVSILAMVLTVVWVKQYLAFWHPPTLLHMFFPFRAAGSLNNIGYGRFSEWQRLWLPALALVLIVAGHRYLLRNLGRLSTGVVMVFLFFITYLADVSITYLSADGLSFYARIVESHFYPFVYFARRYATFGDLWHMISNFGIKEILEFGIFSGTHPPFGYLYNWIILKLANNNSAGISLLLGAMVYTSLLPVYWIGKELYNREIGYYSAALYGLLPNVILFSHGTIDAPIATALNWCIAFAVLGARRQSQWFMFLAGLGAAAVASLSYVTPIFLPLLAGLGVIGLRDRGVFQAGIKTWVPRAVLQTFFFLLGVAIPYGLVMLASHGKFDYLNMMQYTLTTQPLQGVSCQPWFIWSWLGPFQYFIYLGVPVTVLFFLRWHDILKGDWRFDSWPWAGLAIILIPISLSIFRCESERYFLSFNAWVVITAALTLWNSRHGLHSLAWLHNRDEHIPATPSRSNPTWLWILGLLYINTVIIQLIFINQY